MSKTFFQIGTNDGDDLFNKLVQKYIPECIILVEPNKDLINKIKKNYNNMKNVYIYNNAIYYTDDEDIELYIPAKNGVMGTIAENGLIYSDSHFSLVPMNDWGNKNDMAKITTKSITFDKICSNHGITNIDYLQIDTEGFDSEIIKMIDFSKYKINTIRFEKWSFKSVSFTEHNKQLSHELGENGLFNAINKLKDNNYIINEINDSDGNDIIAILNV
jgi:FkbM family methyltransferase